MGRPKTLTDEDILRRARPVFVTRGFGAKTRELAAAVGLTWGAIALRFGSKRTLFEQAMGHRQWIEEPPTGLEDAGDVRALLRRLRSQLVLHWPMYLQLNLSSNVARRGNDLSDGPVRRLASILGRRADRGEVRADLPPQKLAALLFAALIGDAAERFVRREQCDPPDDALVETMLHLLGVNSIDQHAPATPATCREKP